MPELTHQRVLTFVGEIYEDMELQYPKYRLREAGAQVVVAGIEAGVTYHGKHGYPQQSEAACRDLDAANFDALVVPGGFAPDKLRRDHDVKRLVADFEQARKPIATICHGGWIDISAGIVRGYRYTSTPGIKDDLLNAGVAQWIDQPVVIDPHHITSRRPDDLPAFCHALIEMMSSGPSKAEG